MQRYWLTFTGDFARYGMPRAVGVTGGNLADCMRIVRHSFGPEVPDPAAVVEDPNLTDIQTRQIVGGWTVGVPV